MKQRLVDARALGKNGLTAVQSVRADLEPLHDADLGTLIDLVLTCRAIEAYEELVLLISALPRPLQRVRLVREQLGFALNRLKRHADAERVLRELIDEGGPTPETNGLLGRVYKDQY
jgi:hypothetical protein